MDPWEYECQSTSSLQKSFGVGRLGERRGPGWKLPNLNHGWGCELARTQVPIRGFQCFGPPGAPLTYFNEERVGGPKDFFGPDILAKRDLFGSMKDAGIFLGLENNRGIFLGTVFFISSNQK